MSEIAQENNAGQEVGAGVGAPQPIMEPTTVKLPANTIAQATKPAPREVPWPMLAWSIIMVFMGSTILGVISSVYSVAAGQAVTQTEYDKRYKLAKICNIVNVVLAVFMIIGLVMLIMFYIWFAISLGVDDLTAIY